MLVPSNIKIEIGNVYADAKKKIELTPGTRVRIVGKALMFLGEMENHIYEISDQKLSWEAGQKESLFVRLQKGATMEILNIETPYNMEIATNVTGIVSEGETAEQQMWKMFNAFARQAGLTEDDEFVTDQEIMETVEAGMIEAAQEGYDIGGVDIDQRNLIYLDEEKERQDVDQRPKEGPEDAASSPHGEETPPEDKEKTSIPDSDVG